MKTKILFLASLAFFLVPGTCTAQAPHQVGGFVLDTNINDYKEMVNMETALPIRYREYIHELEIKVTDDFKSGLVWIGNCLEPGRILRIKLKYFDSSKKFYNELLSRFKQRFGEPSEWRGDSFHIVIAWKWSFIDKDNNRIGLILQHNTKDTEKKLGNAVKLTMMNLLDEERLCHEKKSGESRQKAGEQSNGVKNRGPVNWYQCIPR
jgi:hypothetical protein